VFACFLEALLERGHAVEVVIEKRKRDAELPAGAGAALRGLARRFPSFSYAQLPAQRDTWLAARTRIRLSIDSSTIRLHSSMSRTRPVSFQ